MGCDIRKSIVQEIEQVSSQKGNASRHIGEKKSCWCSPCDRFLVTSRRELTFLKLIRASLVNIRRLHTISEMAIQRIGLLAAIRKYKRNFGIFEHTFYSIETDKLAKLKRKFL